MIVAGMPIKLKFSYENNVIVCYVNGVAVKQSTTQSPVTIENIGHAYTPYVNVKLKNVAISASGIVHDFSSLSSAGSATNVSIENSGAGFLTPEQASEQAYTSSIVEALAAGKTFYSSYNGVDSVTLLDKPYTINAVGDWFEVKFKFPNWTYIRELAFIGSSGGNTNLFILIQTK